MLVNLFSDPHLGTQRAAHTTRDSAQRLQDALYRQALLASSSDSNICLGDLLDRATNPEAVLVQGFNVAQRCKLVMAGNHDELNRTGVVTTLRALEQMGAPIVASPDISTPFFYTWNQFWIVPHHASQTLFEKAMFEARSNADAQDDGHKYLLLHTNYDVPFDTEDSTLNLSPEMAEEMLKSFDRVFTGHEHNPKTHFNDRLVIVGNVHATSYSDISDKFVWHLDTRTDELTKTCIWKKADNYREIKFGDPVPDLAGVQFVDVIGAEPVDNGVEVAEYVRSIWNAGNTLIAVRNNVEIIDHLASDGIDTSSPALVNLSQRIHDDLEGSDLQPYYQSLVKRVESL